MCKWELFCNHGHCEDSADIVAAAAAGARVALGGQCETDASCEHGRKCRKGRCWWLAEKGDVCGASWNGCRQGLSCIQGYCGKQKAGKQDVGGKCGKKKDCVGGLNCHEGNCVKFGKKGDGCDGEHRLCRKRFVCQNKICVRPRKKSKKKSVIKQERGGVCAKRKDCQHGLKCVDKYCTEFVRKGGDCSGSHRKCRGKKLQCIGGVCKIPEPPKMGVGGNCKRGKHCKNGLKCKKRVCVRLGEPGEQCGSAGYLCRRELLCKNGKCAEKAAAGAPCQKGKDCIKGLQCRNQVCVRFGDVGAQCDDGHVHRCKGKLLCRAGRCQEKADAGGVCKKRKDCKKGLKCQKNVCTVFGAVGAVCGEAGKLCRRQLQCKDNLCAENSGAGGSCKQRKDCQKGLRCKKSVCVKIGKKGASCNIEKSEICRGKLICTDGKCADKGGKGGSCTKKSDCKRGLHCKDEKCTKLSKKGGKCDKERHDLCRGFLVCIDGACADRPPSEIGGQCLKHRNCRKKLRCHDGKCVSFSRRRGKCDGEYLLCRPKLECIDGACMRPAKTVGAGERCAKRLKCADGLSCVKEGRKRATCVAVVGMGGVCGTRGTACEAGLKCDNGTCAKGSLCRNGRGCRKSQKCLTDGPKPRCVKIVGLKKSCRSSRRVCADGLVCRSGRCRPAGAKACLREACTETSECEDGLACLTYSRRGREVRQCLKEVAIGGRCSIKRGQACGEGLVCRSRTCKDKNAKVRVKGSCSDTADCGVGLSCIKLGRRRRCLYPVEEGGNCDSKKGYGCVKGMFCRKKKCQVRKKKVKKPKKVKKKRKRKSS